MKRKKIEEVKEYQPHLGEVFDMIKPLTDADILPERLHWQYTDRGLYIGTHGPFPWKCLRELSNLIVDLFGHETNPKVIAVSDAYLGIMERAKTGETKPEDLKMLHLVIEELRRL